MSSIRFALSRMLSLGAWFAYRPSGRITILHVWIGRAVRQGCLLLGLGMCLGVAEATAGRVLGIAAGVVLFQFIHSVRVAMIRWPAAAPSVIVAIKNGFDFEEGDFALSLSLSPDGTAARLVHAIDPFHEAIELAPSTGVVAVWRDRGWQLIAGSRLAFGCRSFPVPAIPDGE